MTISNKPLSNLCLSLVNNGQQKNQKNKHPENYDKIYNHLDD